MKKKDTERAEMWIVPFKVSLSAAATITRCPSRSGVSKR